ncbi:MAG: ComF family protein [Alphaproteobacteria bacterium]
MEQRIFHHRIGNYALNMAANVVDMVLPPRCPLTGDRVDYQGALSAKAWQGLSFITAPYCKCCGVPFSFDRQQKEQQQETREYGLCMHCLEENPPYVSARAPFTYDDISRALILGFKHGDKTHLVRSFSPWLQRAGREFLACADILIPVPLHTSRLRQRRYNQAAILAHGLTKLTGLPTLPDALVRVRATPSQGHLKKDEREKNVRKAFRVKEKNRCIISNKALVLIDDVYTTGATVNECTKELLKAGAKCVYVLTLARVAKEEF